LSRIAILSPHGLHEISGNNTTRRRLAAGLRAAGHEVGELSVADAAQRVRSAPRFDLVHALHALKAGVVARSITLETGTPYVVSITGTDINGLAALPERTDKLLEVLGDARAVLCASRETIRRLERDAGSRTPMIYVPKGVDLPASPPPLPQEDRPFVFLHVAGWRPVKNNLFALEPLERLAQEFPSLRLRFAGRVLDEPYHRKWLRGREAGRWAFSESAGEVAPKAMGREYAAASVVLNTSHSEGGANAILEAMAHGRVVLASDVEGNRAFVRFREDDWTASTGVLYRTAPSGCPSEREHDAEDFHRKARRLLLEPESLRALSRNALAHIRAEHSPQREIEAVLCGYRLAGVNV